MYEAALGKNTDWQKDVPESVAKIIKENWDVVKQYANSEDQTTRVLGMKFPQEGYSE